MKFTKRQIQDALYVTIGSFVLAVSINSVLLPNKIVAGGANGISVVINHLFRYQPGTCLICDQSAAVSALFFIIR